MIYLLMIPRIKFVGCPLPWQTLVHLDNEAEKYPGICEFIYL